MICNHTPFQSLLDTSASFFLTVPCRLFRKYASWSPPCPPLLSHDPGLSFPLFACMIACMHACLLAYLQCMHRTRPLCMLNKHARMSYISSLGYALLPTSLGTSLWALVSHTGFPCRSWNPDTIQAVR